MPDMGLQRKHQMRWKKPYQMKNPRKFGYQMDWMARAYRENLETGDRRQTFIAHKDKDSI
jgi:hypothetical protein